MGAEAMQFVSSRMEKDIQTQKALMGCKRFEDIQKGLAEFYNKALEDYNAEVALVMELMAAAPAQAT
jgi:hypothetical protein